jgi:death-on-curing protein
VIDLHSDVIHAITPGEPRQILDRGRLEAAVLAPQQTFDGEFVYRSIFAMAAVYMVGLATGHAFQQGNKRIAFVAAATFLRINGFRLALTNLQASQMTLQVVSHGLDRDAVAALFEDNCEILET